MLYSGTYKRIAIDIDSTIPDKDVNFILQADTEEEANKNAIDMLSEMDDDVFHHQLISPLKLCKSIIFDYTPSGTAEIIVNSF